jgi:hypothetical protein
MEFKVLRSVCTIPASHEFAAIVADLLRKGQSKNEPIVVQNSKKQIASSPKQACLKKANC